VPVASTEKPATSKNDPLVGTRLDDYEIVRLIGRGGMARVYEGYDAKLDRRAAIKVIEATHEESVEITQRFSREARAVANLDHPNIVSVYRFGEGPNLYYLAMKLIDGKTLLTIFKKLRLKNKFLEPDRILSILSDVAAAIDYAHSRGVVHRDIKPSNIMLTADDHAILMDFGLSMIMNADSTLGTAFGTPRYIAPEQAISSHRAVPQSDIYSLGVVLYEMVTGRVPFDNDSPMSLALSHITNPPPLPQALRPDLPAAVQTVILKALEKNPEDRWKTATEMVMALRNAYQGIVPDVIISPEMLTGTLSDQASSTEEGISGTAQSGSSTIILPGTPETFTTRPARRRLKRLTSLAGALLIVLTLAVVSLVPQLHIAQLGAALPARTPPSIRLIYDSDMFTVYNASGQTVSLENVSFVRSDLSSRFNVALFGDRAHKVFQAGQCLRIQTHSSANPVFPQICGPQVAPWTLTNPKDMFWLPRDENDQTATFTVQMRDQTLQTCSMGLNTCEFSLP
jgi:serine/threonine protein kinase